MGSLLGTDIGAQSLKVAIYDEVGNSLAFEQIEYPICTPRPGWAEGDPLVWWECFCKGTKRAMERAGIRGEEIESIGISTMCPALVALDDHGRPLRPAILYLDQRSLPQSRRIEREIGLDRIFKLTGNRIAPGSYSVSSMLWIKENEPDLFKKVRFFGHGNTFLAQRLTGEFAFDWTNASLTGLFLTGGERTWSQDLCRELQIRPEILPCPTISSTCVGNLTPEGAQATALTEGIPVAIGGADTACSALGAGIIDPGQAFETSGTSDVLAFCHDRPAFDMRFMNRCHVVPERWLLMGAMLSPGAALSWFRDQFCWEEERIARKTGVSPYRIIDLEAESTPPGANGLVFLPYLRGERSPIWDPLARGVFFGLSLESTRGEMTRAILEGAAFGLRQNLEIGEARLGTLVQDLRVVGGGSKSMVWSQVKADILRRPLTLLAQQETAVLGAALLGGLASGRYADANEAAVKASAKPLRTIFPNPEVFSLYDQMYALYLSLYSNLKDLFPLIPRGQTCPSAGESRPCLRERT